MATTELHPPQTDPANAEALDLPPFESVLPERNDSPLSTSSILEYAKACEETYYRGAPKKAADAKQLQDENKDKLWPPTESEVENQAGRREASIGYLLSELTNKHAEALTGALSAPVVPKGATDSHGKPVPPTSDTILNQRGQARQNALHCLRGIMMDIGYTTHLRDPNNTRSVEELMETVEGEVLEGKYTSTAMGLITAVLERRETEFQASVVDDKEAAKRVSLMIGLHEAGKRVSAYEERMDKLAETTGTPRGDTRRGKRRFRRAAFWGVGHDRKNPKHLPYQSRGPLRSVKERIRMTGGKVPEYPTKDREARVRLQEEINNRQHFIGAKEARSIEETIEGLDTMLNVLTSDWKPETEFVADSLTIKEPDWDSAGETSYRQERARSIDKMDEMNRQISRHLDELVWQESGLSGMPVEEPQREARERAMNRWRGMINGIPPGDPERTRQIKAYHLAIFRLTEAEILTGNTDEYELFRHDTLGLGIVRHDENGDPLEVFWPDGLYSNQLNEEDGNLIIVGADNTPFNRETALERPALAESATREPAFVSRTAHQAAWNKWERSRRPEDLPAAWESCLDLEGEIFRDFQDMQQSIDEADRQITDAEAGLAELQELPDRMKEISNELTHNLDSHTGTHNAKGVSAANKRLQQLQRRHEELEARKKHLESLDLPKRIETLRLRRLEHEADMQAEIIPSFNQVARQRHMLEAHHPGATVVESLEPDPEAHSTMLLGWAASRLSIDGTAGSPPAVPMRTVENPKETRIDNNGQRIHTTHGTMLTAEGAHTGQLIFDADGSVRAA